MNDDAPPLCLTVEEIQSLTDRHRRPAQRDVLTQMGIEFIVRPDGSLAVDRLAYQLRVGLRPAGGMRQARQPQVRTEGLNPGRNRAP
jgi:hypothetical protein